MGIEGGWGGKELGIWEGKMGEGEGEAQRNSREDKSV